MAPPPLAARGLHHGRRAHRDDAAGRPDELDGGRGPPLMTSLARPTRRCGRPVAGTASSPTRTSGGPSRSTGAGPAAADVMIADPPTVVLGDSAAEALLLLLDRDADVVLVTDRAGNPARRRRPPRLHGVPHHRGHLARTSRSAGRRRSTNCASGPAGCRRWSTDLLARGLHRGQVVVLHSAIIDTIVRRSIALVFDSIRN